MNYLESLRLRTQIAVATEADKQAAAKELSRRDPVFFLNNFCWTFDPRKNPQDLPFLLYPYQTDYVRWLVERIEKGEDCLTDKSRDMGATYTALCVYLWFWLFRE